MKRTFGFAFTIGVAAFLAQDIPALQKQAPAEKQLGLHRPARPRPDAQTRPRMSPDRSPA